MTEPQAQKTMLFEIKGRKELSVRQVEIMSCEANRGVDEGQGGMTPTSILSLLPEQSKIKAAEPTQSTELGSE